VPLAHLLCKLVDPFLEFTTPEVLPSGRSGRCRQPKQVNATNHLVAGHHVDTWPCSLPNRIPTRPPPLLRQLKWGVSRFWGCTSGRGVGGRRPRDRRRPAWPHPWRRSPWGKAIPRAQRYQEAKRRPGPSAVTRLLLWHRVRAAFDRFGRFVTGAAQPAGRQHEQNLPSLKKH